MRLSDNKRARLALLLFLLLALPLVLASCAGGAKPKSDAEYQQIGQRLVDEIKAAQAEPQALPKIEQLQKKFEPTGETADPKAKPSEDKVNSFFTRALLYDYGMTGKETEAIDYYQRFIAAARMSEYAPYAMARSAYLLEQKGDLKQAEALYSNVLTTSAKAVIPWGPDLRLIRIELGPGERYDALVKNQGLYKLVDFFVSITGRNPKYSYGLAVILLALLFRLLLFPFTKKQVKAMADMQRVKPLVDEANRKFKGDKERLNKEVMAIYQREGVNPLAGCLPLLVQLPVIFILYKAIRLYNFQFTHASFLWVKKLSEPDMPLLIIYVISMAITQFYTSFSTDSEQRKQNMMMAIMMPAMLAYFFYWFPAAFILFWIALNLAMSYQQIMVARKNKLATAQGTPDIGLAERPRKVDMSEESSPASARRKRRERRKQS